MTQRNKNSNIHDSKLNDRREILITERETIDIMIRGYKEMAEINLSISKMCFGVESEVDDFYNRLTESE